MPNFVASYEDRAKVRAAAIKEGWDPSATDCGPKPHFYNASELASIKQQLKAGNAIMRDAARSRGYTLHPKLAALRAR